MRFNARRDQYAYLVGYISRTRKIQLGEAIGNLIRAGYKNLLPEDVFDFCPFNDDFDQIIKDCRQLENTKYPDQAATISWILQKFIFLFSDFESDCHEGGYTCYVMNNAGEIALACPCDLCGRIYALDGESIKMPDHKNMIKSDFINLFGTETFADWPFHTRIADLQRRV